jgi:hypothetical protein
MQPVPGLRPQLDFRGTWWSPAVSLSLALLPPRPHKHDFVQRTRTIPAKQDRVFRLDHIGPPWPKHPCTDNPPRTIAFDPKQASAPVRRAKGITQELIAAANTVGHFRNKVFGRRLPRDWTLLVIGEIERRGKENTVTAEFLDSSTGEAVRFNCVSAEPVFQTGDTINMKGREVSFLHRATLVPITFLAGSTIHLPQGTRVAQPSAIPIHNRSHNSPGRPGARAYAPVRIAFRLRNSVGARDMNLFGAQWLAYVFPTDASLPSLRAATHGLGLV